MSCARMEGKILGYVDGRLKESERLEVEKHLGSCAACGVCGFDAAPGDGMAGFAPSGWLVECDGYRQDQPRYACARKLRRDFGFCAANGIAATGAGGRIDTAESANVREHETENPIRWMLAGAGDQRDGGAELWPARELGTESRGQ